MTELNQLMYEGHTALRRGKDIGWEQATHDTLDIVYPEAKSSGEVLSRSEIIDKTAKYVGKIVSRPLEPVVFYHPGIAYDLSRFAAIVPDSQQPVDFISSKNQEERGHIRVKALEKKAQFAPITLFASREIVVNSGSESNINVWMGAGARWEDTIIERVIGSTPETRLAVGAEETGQLFDDLSSHKDIHKGRLFGALFHVAWLCNDFGAKFPITTAFEMEVRTAVGSVQAFRDAASYSADQSRLAQMALENAAKHMENRNSEVLMSMFNARELLGDIDLPHFERNREVADSLTEKYSVSNIEGTLSSIVHVSKRSTQAYEDYTKQLNILDELAKPYL